MNLRQIVRNQKLSNFDLTSLISESQRYDDFLDKAPKVPKPGKEGTGQGSSDVLIRTALGYKGKGFKGADGEVDTSQQTAYQNALTYLQGAVETGDLKRRDLPGEFSKDVPSAVGDRYKDKGQDTKKDDEEKVKVSKKKKDTKKKKKSSEERVTVKAELNPPTDPKNEKEISAFMRKTKLRGDGRSIGWAPTTAKMQRAGEIDNNNTPQGNPPSDAAASQTGLDTGFPKKGTKPWPSSQVTGQDAAPAPGNAGSMMNEIFSVEGCNVAEAFYEDFGSTPTVEDIESVLQQQFGDTQLAQDNGGPNGDEYRKKLRIAAQASITKFDRLKNSEANNA